MGEKRERIGNVELNYDNYPGKDLYSEGEAEEQLLSTVREHRCEEYNRLIAESGSWSMLYHLSDIRENIVDFLPVNKDDTVLEIGAGCGAITGALAIKAQKVTCIELSKKRSLINAERHRELSNIEIRVGNFQDIEKELTDKFDYIMLIGVLEYAGSYIDSDSPYEKMLQMLKCHLKEGGSIIIAIENKYGLKYFAGCREDHTGTYYTGIEGYPGIDEVRTFSRKGLERLAEKTGLVSEFYYPYPDYKLPITIYSDERLPRVSELSDGFRNFDYDRFVSFDEAAVYDELIREEEVPFFSNSFLVIIRKGSRIEGMTGRRVLYSRHSVERRQDRQIRTDLELAGNGERIISKYPVNEASRPHLESMARGYERLCGVLSGTKFKPNRVKRINDGEGNLRRLEFEYLSGPTLEDELNICRSEKKTDDALLVIRSYCETLRGLKDMTDFEMTERFKEIFGDIDLPAGLKCMPVTDVDMIFTNLISDKGWNIIDYEWTFDFPIPVDFVIYRSVFYFCRDMGQNDIDGLDLFAAAGIPEDLKGIFEKMEHNFQLYIKGDRITLPEMYSIMRGDVLTLDRALKTASLTGKINRVKLYFDLGEGFGEKDVLFIDADIDEDSRISFDIKVPQNCRALRIDPADYRCFIKLYLLENGIEEMEAMVNGYVFADNTVMYDTDDPQIVIDRVLPGMKIHVEYLVSMLPEEMFEDMALILGSGKKPSGISRLKGVKKGSYVRVKV